MDRLRIESGTGAPYSVVVPANAGTHNHRCSLAKKPPATVPKREAAAYGSLRSQGRRLSYDVPFAPYADRNIRVALSTTSAMRSGEGGGAAWKMNGRNSDAWHISRNCEAAS
jgi:hypothetical protein